MTQEKTQKEKDIEDKFYAIWLKEGYNLKYGGTSHDLALFFFKKAYSLSAKAEREKYEKLLDELDEYFAIHEDLISHQNFIDKVKKLKQKHGADKE